jgi:exonuclease VII large subunit
MARERAAVDGHQRALIHLSPRKVLERGYSITTVTGDPRPIRDAATVRPGQELLTTLARGELRSIVAKEPPARAASGPARSEAEGQRSLFDERGDG